MKQKTSYQKSKQKFKNVWKKDYVPILKKNLYFQK